MVGLYVLLGVVVLVAVVAGGLVWPNSAPDHNLVGALVHVGSTRWQVEGCSPGTYLDSGANAAARASFTVSVLLGNASIARECTFLGVTATTPGFSVVNGSMALSLPYDELAVLYVTVVGPAVYWTGTLNLTVLAASST